MDTCTCVVSAITRGKCSKAGSTGGMTKGIHFFLMLSRFNASTILRHNVRYQHHQLETRKMTGPKAVVIAGPSGVGKGTLIEKLRSEYPKLFGFSVSHTSRAPRPGEKDGFHYHFTSADEILKQVSEGKFIEHAEVHGRHYGTSIAAVDSVKADGKICILDIDVQGCRSARKKGLDASYVFISPPSLEALERRLRGRGTENEGAILKRLGGAKIEIEAKDEEGLFNAVIVNDDLSKAYEELKNLLNDDIDAASKAQHV